MNLNDEWVEKFEIEIKNRKEEINREIIEKLSTRYKDLVDEITEFFTKQMEWECDRAFSLGTGLQEESLNKIAEVWDDIKDVNPLEVLKVLGATETSFLYNSLMAEVQANNLNLDDCCIMFAHNCWDDNQ